MSSEVRSFFIKLIAYLAHYSLQDDTISIPAIASSNLFFSFKLQSNIIILNFVLIDSLLDTTASLSDHLIIGVLSLLQKEVGEHTNRHLPHYFSFFYMYCNLGMAEKQQLIRVIINTLLSTIVKIKVLIYLIN